MRILIAGGGIGGLTAALCAAHRGHRVELFERATAFAEVGAGIQLPPNAMNVFRALGLDERLASVAFRPEAIEMRMGRTGRAVFQVSLGDRAPRRWGAPYLHIHRADYVSVLAEALQNDPKISVHLGASVERFAQTERDVSVELGDGRTVRGDVLIGADGIRSRVRAQMHGPDDPVFTGNVAWRVVVPMDRLGSLAPDPTACAWVGKGRHAVTYRLRRGELANFVGVVERDDPADDGWSARGSREDALRDFVGWHPVIASILQAAGADDVYRWALYDRLPLRSWTQGRATLLGDAAHPMLPFLAQGAAMAVEDAWVLARDLSEPGRSVEQALQAYQSARLARTARVQAASRANMKTFHRRTLPAQLATYGPMWLAGHVAPWIVRRRLDWLYGHDVTMP
ncbi:MAG: FAD-dependent monooxygenase [Litorimonas sp.]